MTRGKIVNFRNKVYPFSRLNKKAREMLLFIPNSWVLGSANWLLDARRVDLLIPTPR